MASLHSIPVVRAADLRRWDARSRKPHIAEPVLSYQALAGRLVECTSRLPGIYLTPLCTLVKDAQNVGQPVVWICATDAIFFPPDAAANGIDLDALPVVWAPDTSTAVRASEHLLRSHAFGLVIIDLALHAIVEQGRLGKLARLADRHHAAVVIATKQEEKTTTSLGSMISLRLEIERAHGEASGYGYDLSISAVKDKQRACGWGVSEHYHGPDGVC